jgi:soluble lytic murein transglycosylase-like protein
MKCISIIAALLMSVSVTHAGATDPEWVKKASGNTVSEKEAIKITKLIRKNAKKEHVDPKVIFQIAKVESHFNKNAVSPKGAMGIMQVFPKWHKEKIKDRDIMDPAVNIEVGTKIYAAYLKTYKTQAKALYAYNGLRGIPGDYSGLVLGTRVDGKAARPAKNKPAIQMASYTPQPMDHALTEFAGVLERRSRYVRFIP